MILPGQNSGGPLPHSPPAWPVAGRWAQVPGCWDPIPKPWQVGPLKPVPGEILLDVTRPLTMMIGPDQRTAGMGVRTSP